MSDMSPEQIAYARAVDARHPAAAPTADDLKAVQEALARDEAARGPRRMEEADVLKMFGVRCFEELEALNILACQGGRCAFGFPMPEHRELVPRSLLRPWDGEQWRLVWNGWQVTEWADRVLAIAGQLQRARR
jgi:hypothetical protein